MLIPRPFHGQSSTEDVEAVFSDPAVLASTGKYPMGQNPDMFAPESFGNLLHHQHSRSYGPHTVSQGSPDRALCAPMLLNQASLSPT